MVKKENSFDFEKPWFDSFQMRIQNGVLPGLPASFKGTLV
jgi:hypothetical protein